MASYSQPNIKFVGSHAGVSIGEDGPSQMGLEDISMFRSLAESIILYPSDAVSAEKLVEEMVREEGLVYLRTTRSATPIIYKTSDKFPIGGSKILKSSRSDVATVVAAGITVFEALKAAEQLERKGLLIRVIDAYSIKPIDKDGLIKAATKSSNIVISVEDHRIEGGLGDAVLEVFADLPAKVYKLAVTKIPTSGKPEELMDLEGISAKAIVRKVSEVTKKS